MKINYLQTMMDRIRGGEQIGIPSYCTANELVIRTILQRAGKTGQPVLIEATANQVNQDGGYTGMKPADYYDHVRELAAQAGVSETQLILGGDHLGPLTWQGLPEEEAMARSAELVRQYVRAGFTKIHLDTSMKLADDPAGPLDAGTVARRGVQLYQECMTAYEELRSEQPDAIRPVFIIGSEVPIPGGATEQEDTLAVTKPEDFRSTVAAYREAFDRADVPDGMKDVIAVVVQPGVEFGDDQIFLYDREAAAQLTAARREEPGLIFEGHSTDYQSPDCLRQMVEDGIGILKVGPALTYAMREAVFALSMMEEELVPGQQQAKVIDVLEEVMLEEPGNWQGHYHGTQKQQALARKYSFSDRARYYIGDARVSRAIDHLFENLRQSGIPMNMLHQYMPRQFEEVRAGRLQPDPQALAQDAVVQVLLDYEYAADRS